jgi:hypothetical protein
MNTTTTATWAKTPLIKEIPDLPNWPGFLSYSSSTGSYGLAGVFNATIENDEPPFFLKNLRDSSDTMIAKTAAWPDDVDPMDESDRYTALSPEETAIISEISAMTPDELASEIMASFGLWADRTDLDDLYSFTRKDRLDRLYGTESSPNEAV